MELRKLRNFDVERLRHFHHEAGYGFEFPLVTQMESAFVAVDQGHVIGFAGAELRAEIIGVFDPSWGSPHQRMEVFASLHLPIAEQLKLREVKTGYCFADPKFPRFGERLRELGWAKTWDCYSLSVAECIKALRR